MIFVSEGAQHARGLRIPCTPEKAENETNAITGTGWDVLLEPDGTRDLARNPEEEEHGTEPLVVSKPLCGTGHKPMRDSARVRETTTRNCQVLDKTRDVTEKRS